LRFSSRLLPDKKAPFPQSHLQVTGWPKLSRRIFAGIPERSREGDPDGALRVVAELEEMHYSACFEIAALAPQ
jgi:hypothetical protein